MTPEQSEQVSELMGHCYDKPLDFVMYSYPWQTDKSIQIVELPEPYRDRFPGFKYGPDLWACEMLDEIGECIKNNNFDGFNAVPPIRYAISSGHGIGKSVMTAWLVNFIMSTRPFARGTVTANTAPQLESKTWAGIAAWTKKCITADWFTVTTGRGSMRMYQNDNPETWYCSAQTCREENSEAFAGQHAANSTSFYIFDEASAIPDIFSEVAEGGLATGEPMFFKFGNPTRNRGDFFDCFNGQKSKRWRTRVIDSRDVQITNKRAIQELIDDYGIDSDRVKVRVRGMFPSRSSLQFIETDVVDKAYGKKLADNQFKFAPVIISCDPAWTGDDDLIIAKRQGLDFKILTTMQNNDDDMKVANVIANFEDEYKADAVFIDGGFGTGIYSGGKSLGRDWRLVWFSEKSADVGCVNKRAEMYSKMRQWLKEGGAIQDDYQLYSELISVELIPRDDGKLQLESKKDMKKRGMMSPNKADALAITFAYNVTKQRILPKFAQSSNSRSNYDPYKQAFN